MTKLCFACCLTMLLFTQLVSAQAKAEEGKPKEEPKPRFRKTSSNGYVMDERSDRINGLVRLGYFSITTKEERDESAKDRQKPSAYNGVTMHLDLSYDSGAKVKDDFIVLEWGLGYVGKSTPRTILVPSLFTFASKKDELTIHFDAEGIDGKVYSLSYCNYDFGAEQAELGGEAFHKKKQFKTIKGDGQGITGKIKIPLGMIMDDLNHISPKNFDLDKYPELHAWAIFEPKDRGEDHNLDAWTGKVISNNGVLLTGSRADKK